MKYKFIVSKINNSFNDLNLEMYELCNGHYDILYSYTAHAKSINKYFEKIMSIMAKSKMWEIEESKKENEVVTVIVKSLFNLENIIEKQTF